MNSEEQILLHLKRAETEDDYSAVNTLWIGLTKAAQQFEGTEMVRVQGLLAQIGSDLLKDVLHCEGVDRLLGLDPPIESIVTYPNEEEWLDASAARDHVETIRKTRDEDPLNAAASLGWLLRRIRNRREHGFKTPTGSRDGEILAATRVCLRRLNEASLRPHQVVTLN